MRTYFPKADATCIYTSGAYLEPLMVMGDDGNIEWVWAVASFNDDTYLDGKTCAPVERAETLELLFKTYDDDDDYDDEEEDDDNNN
jgi:hypothetical protein